MGLKLAVVGGGSTYTPELVDGFARRTTACRSTSSPCSTSIPSGSRSSAGSRERMPASRAGRAGSSGPAIATSAIDGADFVLLQLRVGGQAARFGDETLPPRFGLIGQETVGAGGFAKALRTVPVVLEIAEEAGRRAAPGAWIVDFTNPVGIVTQALVDGGHRAIGLCNVAIGFQRGSRRGSGSSPEEVELEQVGLNHLTWIRAVRVDGVDRLPELLDADGERSPRTSSCRSSACGRWADPVLLPPLLRRRGDGPGRARRRADPGRGGHDDRARPARAVPRPDARHEARAARAPRRRLLQRGSRPADRVAVRRPRRRPGRRRPQRRRLPGLPATDVVEVPARIDRDGALRCPRAAGAGQAASSGGQGVRAAGDRRRRPATGRSPWGRSGHPLIPGYEVAAPLLDALLDAHRAHLPRFFADRPRSRRQPRPDLASPRSVARPVVTAGAVRAARPSAPGGARSGAPPPA